MLIIICGATATGKSSLALNLASRLNSIIISADSRQVYREFNLGTAKPTLAEQQLIPHYLIDIKNPTNTITVAEYQELVNKIVYSHLPPLTPSPPLLVGGTGLYIKSIARGLRIPRVAPHPELRSQLMSYPQTQLYAFLSQVDPVATKRIHPNDIVRILRALEVYYVTGLPISAQQGENPPNYPILQIGLHCDRQSITKRIQQRTEQMIEMGLVKEVENLGKKYGWDLPLLSTLGYQEIKQYLAGDISLSDAVNLTVLHTRQFAKRQETWFKNDQAIHWYQANCSDLLETVWQQIIEFIG